jgi:hypothetical protein
MRGNEKGTCHINQTSGKVEKLFMLFRRVKNRVTLFLKQQLAILKYLNSVTMVSLSTNGLNDTVFVLDMCSFHSHASN